MTSIEKLIKKFLENPKSLTYNEIEKIMLKSGFVVKWWKWSHKKVKNTKTNKSIMIPIHNNDCTRVYKEDLREAYINNQK